MGQKLEEIEKIQNEINSELENLGMDPVLEQSSSLSDKNIQQIDKDQKEDPNIQGQIAQELEDALSDSQESINDVSDQVDDALGEIEAMMGQDTEDDHDSDEIGAFDENELDEIMSEIDDEMDNVLPLSSNGKDMCFQASGEIEAKMGFNLQGKNVSFEVDKNGSFKFQMDQLTLTVDEDNNVIVDLGNGMQLTAPLEDSKNFDKKKAV